MNSTTRSAFAPGRANLIGEHTDYNGGRCLPIALPLRTTATWVPSGATGPGAALSLTSDGLGTWQGTVADLSRGLHGWSAYALGALAALRHDEGGHLRLSSTVPTGSGLSSSAAVICAVQRAVSSLPNAELVAPAIAAETVHAQAPTGGLDQTISLLGQAGQALLLDFSTGERQSVGWAPERDGVTLLVVDSKIQHANSDGGYATRRAECEAARDLLEVDHLAAAEATAPAGLPEPLRRRARHVVSETARVDLVAQAAQDRDWVRVGDLFTTSHASLRDDFEVSCAEVDAAVEAALGAGALGARMTGGGFGGSLLVLTREPEAARAAITARYAAQGWLTPEFHAAPASAGAARITE